VIKNVSLSWLTLLRSVSLTHLVSYARGRLGVVISILRNCFNSTIFTP